MTRTCRLFLLLVLSACEHTTPFAAGTYTPAGPLGAGNPIRLTYNAATDERASWLPDGQGFLYTEVRTDLPNHERCLALLPAAGGSIKREICASSLAIQDSLISFESPAVSADGRMAYFRTSVLVAPSPVIGGAILVGTYADPAAAVPVVTFPYFGPTARPVDIGSNVHWINPTSLVYIAERATVRTCLGCVPDTVRWGQEIDRVDFAGATPVVSYVSGTDQASSLAMVGSDTLYYTINGDTRIHRRILSSGADTAVYDFGGAGIARDVSVARGRIAAVVGGQVSFSFDSAFGGMMQVDHGGVLHVVTAGVDATLSDSSMVTRRPALAPGGGSVVTEVRPAFPPGPPGLPLIPTDLWLWTLP